MGKPNVISTQEVQGQGAFGSLPGTRARLLWPPALSNVQVHHGEVHIWAFVLEPGRTPIEDYARILSEEERCRALRFHFERDRGRYIVAHGVLRRLLALHLGISPAAIDFSTGRNGKPFLGKQSAVYGIHFNLSHSADLGVVAVASDGPVGVDVERLRPLMDASDLVARFFSPREREAFERLPDDEKTAAFFRLWTRKEAWLKATGEGISESLHEVEVTFLPGDQARIAALPAWAEPLGSWRLRELEPAAGFIGAAAIPNPCEHVNRWSWDEEIHE